MTTFIPASQMKEDAIWDYKMHIMERIKHCREYGKLEYKVPTTINQPIGFTFIELGYKCEIEVLANSDYVLLKISWF